MTRVRPEGGGSVDGAPGRALVVTASNRAAAGVYADRGGPLIAEHLKALGFEVEGPRVVADGVPVARALRAGVADGYDVIVTTGGTGISPTDATPEATREVIDHEVPGIAEAIRAFGRQKVATAALSRGLAGVAGRTLIVNLPGSTGGVRDGLTVLEDLLPHALTQLRGGDHPGPSSGPGAASAPPAAPSAATASEASVQAPSRDGGTRAASRPDGTEASAHPEGGPGSPGGAC